jgi:hypothetical protein
MYVACVLLELDQVLSVSLITTIDNLQLIAQNSDSHVGRKQNDGSRQRLAGRYLCSWDHLVAWPYSPSRALCNQATCRIGNKL